MSTTPRKSGGQPHGTPQKVPLNGFFQDGDWHCNCQPRLPASHFLVRKESPNKGRWFYTCQETKDKGCGFFLWDEDAALREMKTGINNSRSEIADPPGKILVTKESQTGAKRAGEIGGKSKKDIKQLGYNNNDDGDEFDGWPLSREDEVAVVQAVENSVASTPLPETPQKSAKFNKIVTPSSKRKRDHIDTLPTPTTSRSNKDVFSTPGKPRGGLLSDRNISGIGLLSPSETPTPARFRGVETPSNQHSSVEDGGKDFAITTEIMRLLENQLLDEEIRTTVKQTLDRHALNSQGIARGRDITRIALKNKESKIAELQQRITALETEREMDKLVIKHFKSDMAESVARRARPGSRGRGRGRDF